jgi:hypothetical protein
MKSSNPYNNIVRGCSLAPSSHCSILIETQLAGKAGLENDLSIVPMRATFSQFYHLRLYHNIKVDLPEASAEPLVF